MQKQVELWLSVTEPSPLHFNHSKNNLNHLSYSDLLTPAFKNDWKKHPEIHAAKSWR